MKKILFVMPSLDSGGAEKRIVFESNSKGG